jgi:hypothetical protein
MCPMCLASLALAAAAKTGVAAAVVAAGAKVVRSVKRPAGDAHTPAAGGER